MDFSCCRFCPAPVSPYKQWSARLLITSTHVCGVVRFSGCCVEWWEEMCWEGCRRKRFWPNLRYYPSTGVTAWAKLLGVHVCLQYQISSVRHHGNATRHVLGNESVTLRGLVVGGHCTLQRDCRYLHCIRFLCTCCAHCSYRLSGFNTR